MFIWDFVADTVLGQIVDWVYGQIIGFLGNFFAEMGNMGADLFEMSWVQSIILFFVYLAWALYGTGLVVSAFECGIEYQSGRGSIKDTALNAVKGFMAVSLFSTVPVELYKLAVSLQSSLTAGITGYGSGIETLAGNIISELSAAGSLENAGNAGVFGGMGGGINPIMMIFILILMGYAVIKVFFANLKRGGILLIQISVGSLYMFSVPRGYIDGFVSWCKQIVGLCLTAFLQSTILIAGLMVVKDHSLLGLGLMLSAGEIPRIAGAFGLDTSTRANLMSAAYAAQTAVNMQQLGKEREWKAQTVISLLLRLVERGFIRTEKNGKERTFFPLISKEDYLKFETGNFMKRFHANSFASLVATLCDGDQIKDSDLDQLEKWLKEKRD